MALTIHYFTRGFMPRHSDTDAGGDEQDGEAVFVTCEVDSAAGAAIQAGTVGLQSIEGVIESDANPAAVTGGPSGGTPTTSITVPGTNGDYFLCLFGKRKGETSNHDPSLDQ